MLQIKFTRIDHEDDPERCQGIIPSGQCGYKRIAPEIPYCPMHSGGGTIRKLKEEQKMNYLRTRWRAQIQQYAENSQVKSLREEVGILRLLLENLLLRCKDSEDLFLYSSKIEQLAINIEKLVVSCHKLEKSTGALVDKQVIVVLANSIVEKISLHVKDEDLLSIIGQEILEIVKNSEMIAIENQQSKETINAPA